MAKELKEIIVTDIDQRFAGMESCILVDYRGLNSEQTVDLRNALRQTGVRMTVVHNRLFKRALGTWEAFPDELSELFQGPTAVLYGEGSALDAAKSLSNWQKKHKGLAGAKGGYFDGKVLTESEVSELAKIPDKETLLNMTAGMFLSPLQFIASSAKSLLAHFAGCAKERHSQLESESESES